MKDIEMLDHEVLAVSSWLSVKWPRLLPSLRDDVVVESAQVDEAAERLGTSEWLAPLDDNAQAMVEAVLAVVDGQDAAMVYGYDDHFELSTWSVLSWFGDEHALVETVVASNGRHTFSLGNKLDAVTEFVAAVRSVFESGMMLDTSVVSVAVVPATAEGAALVVTRGGVTLVAGAAGGDGVADQSGFTEWDDRRVVRVLGVNDRDLNPAADPEGDQ